MAESQIQVLGMRESSFNGSRSQQQFTQPLHIGIVKSRTILAKTTGKRNQRCSVRHKHSTATLTLHPETGSNIAVFGTPSPSLWLAVPAP